MKNRRCHFCKRRQRGGSWQRPPAPGPCRGHRSCAPQSWGRQQALEPLRGRGLVTTGHMSRSHQALDRSCQKSRGDPPAPREPFLKGGECCRRTSAEPLAPNRAVWGAVGFPKQGPARGLLAPATSLNAHLPPGFVGTPEEAVSGLLPHPAPLWIHTDPRLDWISYTGDKRLQL